MKMKFLIRFIMTLTMVCFFMSGIAMAGGDKPTYAKTKYPIILVHGVCGFDDLLGLVDYWYKIEDELRDQGATVRAANIQAMSSNDARGEELLSQIKTFLAEKNAAKVNIIAHSHGCTTSRYVVGVRPDLVASFTSIAGPHRGSPVAEFANEELPPAIQVVGFGIGDLLGKAISFFGGSGGMTQDTQGLVYHFSEAGITEFNNNFPTTALPPLQVNSNGEFSWMSRCDMEGAYSEILNGNEVRYWSWTGAKGFTNILDALDYLWPALQAINRYYGLNGDDGFVGRCGARFGEVLRDDYPWNHADEVNHLFGIRGLGTPSPVDVVKNHANRIKNVGL